MENAPLGRDLTPLNISCVAIHNIFESCDHILTQQNMNPQTTKFEYICFSLIFMENSALHQMYPKISGVHKNEK